MSDGTSGWTYDVENRLVAASNGTELRYDPLGRLDTVTKAGATTRFVYAGSRLVAEYDGAGALLRRYVHGGGVDDPRVWYEGAGTASPRHLYPRCCQPAVAASAAPGRRPTAPASG